MAKKRGFLKRVRRSAKRKRLKNQAVGLEAWFNDRTPNPAMGGKSPYEIFRAVGIRNAVQLKAFLDMPEMQTYLKMSGLKEGEAVVVELRGVKYRAACMDGRLMLTDDLEMHDRIESAFDRAGVPRKFDNAMEVKAWIDSLPKWGMPSDIPVKKQIIHPVTSVPDLLSSPEKKPTVVLPMESRLVREAKKVSDSRLVNGHATADAWVDRYEYADWLTYARKNMPDDIKFGRDLNASVTMIGDMVKVHWYSKNEKGDQYLQILLDSLRTYDGKLTNPITGEQLNAESGSAGAIKERDALLPAPDSSD